MRRNIVLLVLMSVLTISFTSCRGAAGKEGAEYIEKKGGSLLKKLFKENSERELTPYQKYKIHEALEDLNNQRQPQPVDVVSGKCQQRGFVYLSDSYGNILIDDYGNAQTIQCPSCGGRGVVTIYQ